MTQVQQGRWSAEVPDGTVVFLIGMRVNRLRAVHRWGPTALAMTRMLTELGRTADLGLLGVQQFVSGRTVLGLQYWQDWDHLHAYAGDATKAHLPAWRAFNRSARQSTDVGVFHETYVTGAGQHEAVHVNMPLAGLLRATTAVPVGRRGDSAAHRLDPSLPDRVTVDA